MFNSVFRRMSFGVLLLMVVTVPALIAGEEIKWEETLEDTMTKAEKTGKPMMMDFYTDW